MLQLFLLVLFLHRAFQNGAALEVVTDDEGQEFLVSESVSETVIETETPTEMASAETTSTRDFGDILEEEGITLQGHRGEGDGVLDVVDTAAIESICSQSEWPEEEAGYFVRCTASGEGIQPQGAIFYGKTSEWTTQTSFTTTETITSSITVSTLNDDASTPLSGEKKGEEEEPDLDSGEDSGQGSTDESANEKSVSQDEQQQEGDVETEEGGGGVLTVTSTDVVDAANGGGSESQDYSEDESSSAQRREEPFDLHLLGPIGVIMLLSL